METKELKGQELVSALLAGSSEIDRMRISISQVVGMVVSFIERGSAMQGQLPPLKQEDGLYAFSFPYPTGKWETRIVKRSGLLLTPDVHIWCWVDGIIAYDHSNNGHFIQPHLEDVQKVYEGLPTLVAGLLNEFSFLKRQWQPLLDAAAAAKARRQN